MNRIAEKIRYYEYFKIKYKDKDIFKQTIANKTYNDIKDFVTIKTNLRKQEITRVSKIVFDNLVIDCYYWSIGRHIKNRE